MVVLNFEKIKEFWKSCKIQGTDEQMKQLGEKTKDEVKNSLGTLWQENSQLPADSKDQPWNRPLYLHIVEYIDPNGIPDKSGWPRRFLKNNSFTNEEICALIYTYYPHTLK